MEINEFIQNIPGIHNRALLKQYLLFEQDSLLLIKIQLAVALGLKVDFIHKIIVHHVQSGWFASCIYDKNEIKPIAKWLSKYCSEKQLVDIVKSLNPISLESFKFLGKTASIIELESFKFLGKTASIIELVHEEQVVKKRLHRRIRNVNQLLVTVCYLLELVPDESFDLPLQKTIYTKLNGYEISDYVVKVPVKWYEFQEISHKFLNCLGGKNIKQEVKHQKTAYLLLYLNSQPKWILSLSANYEIKECRGVLNTNPPQSELNKIIADWNKKVVD